MEKDQLMRFQNELGIIAGGYHTLGCVFPSGKMDKTTQNAVKELQGMLGIKRNGQIDAQTYMQGTALAKKMQKQTVAEKMQIFPCGRVYCAGDKHDVIAFVQLIINAVAKKYSNVPAVQINRVMDGVTLAAVKKLRVISGLSEEACVDAEFFSLLLRLYGSVAGQE